MKITKRQLSRIIKEEIATINKDAIKDTVMDVLSDEGGAAGLEPIEDALEELEDEDMSLPEEPIEDIVGDVDGVKRHVDGDYVDTTQLEGKSMKLTRQQLKRIIKEEKAKVLAEQKVRRIVRRKLLEQAGGATYVVEQRSGASNAGVIQGTGVKIFTSDNVANNPAAQEPNASVYPGTFNSAADMRNFANWLKDTHGVTHVQDNDLEFDLGMPEGGPGLAIDEWAEMQ